MAENVATDRQIIIQNERHWSANPRHSGYPRWKTLATYISTYVHTVVSGDRGTVEHALYMTWWHVHTCTYTNCWVRLWTPSLAPVVSHYSMHPFEQNQPNYFSTACHAEDVYCSRTASLPTDRHTYTHTQTDRPNTVILAVHACRGLISTIILAARARWGLITCWSKQLPTSEPQNTAVFKHQFFFLWKKGCPGCCCLCFACIYPHRWYIRDKYMFSQVFTSTHVQLQ